MSEIYKSTSGLAEFHTRYATWHASARSNEVCGAARHSDLPLTTLS